MLTQTVSITEGGTFVSRQHATGQDFEITGLDDLNGATVGVALYTRKEAATMDEALGVTVASGAITFKQNDLFGQLKAAYKDSALIKADNYRLRVLAHDGALEDHLPEPRIRIRFSILKSEAVTLPEAAEEEGVTFGGQSTTFGGTPVTFGSE